jgi:hypothetical protein
MNSPEKNPALANEIKKILETLPPEPLFQPCEKHPEKNSLILCASCGKGSCRECLAETPFENPFLCLNCRLSEEKRKKLSTLQKIISYSNAPIIWTLACIAVSAAVFGFGFGKPSLEKYQTQDAKLPWFRQRAGKFLLSKAAREQRRSAVLLENGNFEKSRTWALMAANSFLSTTDFWKDTKVRNDLLLAHCRMLSLAEKKNEAKVKLEFLQIKTTNRLFPYFILIETLTEKNGGYQTPNNEKISNALHLIENEKNNSDIIDRLASNAPEEEFIEKVRIICGTSPSSQMTANFAKTLPQADRDKNLTRPPEEPESEEKDNGKSNDRAGDFEIELK